MLVPDSDVILIVKRIFQMVYEGRGLDLLLPMKFMLVPLSLNMQGYKFEGVAYRERFYEKQMNGNSR